MKIKLQLKDIIKNNTLINLLGLNPWCLNEGLGNGDEYYEFEVNDSFINSVNYYLKKEKL
jgi:hypothetical protein